MLDGGVDAVLVETAQDLLQAKAAIIGAQRAVAKAGYDDPESQPPLIVNVTVETTGTMLLGTEIGAALTALEPLGIDLIGLNCATGPAEMSEHLRYLSRHSAVADRVHAERRAAAAHQGRCPLSADPGRAGSTRTTRSPASSGSPSSGDAAVRRLSTSAGSWRRCSGRELAKRKPRREPGASSLYQHVPFRQDTSYLSIGERTNANGSKAFKEAMLAEKWDDCIEIARSQIRDGAHLLDLNVDYVGRDGVADMRTMAFRLATSSTLPIVLDSTEPELIEAGLETLAGRCVINSVNYEDGDGPTSRFARVMPIIKEHGAAVVALTIDEEGQARTADWKVAGRLAADRRRSPASGGCGRATSSSTA